MKPALSKKKLGEFKDLLSKKMDTLVKEARAQVGEMVEVKEPMADLSDQASFELERDRELRRKDRERKHILKIKEVIGKIDDGTYGICEICGEPIGENRLRERPETTACIECKTDMEEQERRMEA